MGRLLRYAIVMLLADITMVNFSVFARDMSVAKAFEEYQVVPDVISEAPCELLTVKYNSNVVNKGNELTPTQVKDIPRVSFKSEPNGFYTLTMVDPDAPSRILPTSREMLHWLVGNIPGKNVAAGEKIAAYIGAGPPKGTGLHRYVLLVYKQPGKLTFDERRVSNTTVIGRPKFSIRNFARKYKLGKPIAGNFFQAQYDDYVLILNKQLGLL